MSRMRRSRGIAAALALLLAGGCAGGATAPGAARPRVAINPVVTGAQGEARLAISLGLAPAGLTTKALRLDFDHARITLKGPLLEQPRELDLAGNAVNVPDVVVTTVAGKGEAGDADGNGQGAVIDSPSGIAIDSQGNLIVSEYYTNRMRKIDKLGNVSTITTTGLDGPNQLAIDDKDFVYVADTGSNSILRVTPSGEVSEFAGGQRAGFTGPSGVAFGPDGYLYVGDNGNNTIRRIDTEGNITDYAGDGQAASLDGDGTSASLDGPDNLGFDRAGNLYVAEFNGNRIRKIAPGGHVSTLAGNGVKDSVDGSGAGASFNKPQGLTVDAAGNVWVSELDGHRIRRVSPAGVVTTVAGDGTVPAPTTDTGDGTGTASRFNNPYGLVTTPDGTLFVADTLNRRVRRVDMAAASAAGVIGNLRPGAGYRLAVTLYDGPDPNGRVIASGSADLPVLAAGTNQGSLQLTQTAAVQAAQPLPVVVSCCLVRQTANAPGQPTSVVVMGADLIAILPGVLDPLRQLRRIRAYVEPAGDPGARQLLGTWYPDGFGSPLQWDLNQPLTPPVIGTPPEIVMGGPDVQPPNRVLAEGTPNYTLTFTLHDRNAPSDNDLIGSYSYPLTVLEPYAINVGVQ